MIRKAFVWCLVLAFSCLPALAQEMVFSAQASARKVGTKDQFQLTFSLSNVQGVGNFRPPAFTGFKVVDGPYQSNSSNLIKVNGQVRQTSTVNLTYILMPLKAGNLTIGPAHVDVGGRDISSNSVTLQVVNGSVAPQNARQQRSDPFEDDPFAAIWQRQQQMMQRIQQQQRGAQRQAPSRNSQMEALGENNINKNIFIRVEVDKTNPYVGEQITASYKLYTRLAMSVNLTQLPSLNGFWSQDFQIPNPPKPREEVINGQRYQVFLLKKSALFPQQDGSLELDPAKAEGVVRVVQKVKGRNPFADDPMFGSFFMDDPFFNDDFFSGYDYKDVQVKLSSQPVKINVRPLPLQNQPASFTGAVGDFRLSASIDKSSLSTDDAATLTVTVSGSGNLKLIGNPPIDFPAALGVYDPQITDTITGRNPAITGSKVFTYSMNPQSPGDYTIPAIAFSYYDPQTGAYKTLNTSPVKVHVTKGRHYNPAGVAGKKLPGDIHGIRTGDVLAGGRTPLASRPWYWLLYPAGIALLGALLIRKRQQDIYASNQALFRNKKANKIAWKRLAAARKLLPQQEHKAFYEEVSKAIWLYLSDKLGIPLSGLSKENVAAELENKQVPVAQIDRVKSLVLECEMALYSPGGGRQQRQHTLDEAAGTIGELETVLKNKNSLLQHAG